MVSREGGILISFKGASVDQESILACVRESVAYPLSDRRPKGFMQLLLKQQLVSRAEQVLTR